MEAVAAVVLAAEASVEAVVLLAVEAHQAHGNKRDNADDSFEE